MPRDPEIPLGDVLAAIEELQDFTRNRTFENFANDRLLQAAVERKLEVIGEALNRLKAIDASLLDSITGATSIIGMRNIIAHGYDVVDHDIIWDAVQNHLPQLKADVVRMNSGT